MAISIARTVKVTIQNQTTAVETANFSTPLIAAYVTATEVAAGTWGTTLVREFANLSSMTSTGGFTANSAAYRVVAAMFSQTPTPATVKVGRLTTAPDITIDLTPASAVVGRTYSVVLLGPAGLTATASYTAITGDTVALICAGLTLAINTAVVGITATNNATKVTCKAASAGMHFSVAAVVSRWLNVAQVQTQANIETELDAILLADKSWYGLTLATGSADEIVAAAHWVGVNTKYGMFTTIDTGCAAGVMATIHATSNNRVQVVYCGHGLSDQGGAAKLAKGLSYKPGACSWEYMQLSNVTVDDLTEDELTAIAGNQILGTFGAHGGALVVQGGVAVTHGDITAGTQFLDYTRDIDYSKDRIEAGMWQAFINNAKIIFSDVGIQTLVNALRSAIDQDVVDGIAQSDPAPVIVYPAAADISDIDKGARRLPGLSYSYTYGTAIHAVEVTGTITL
jgi:hypothetical protein